MKRKLEPSALSCLFLSAFAGAFSLPAGRAFLGLSLVLLVAHMICAKEMPRFPPVAWLAVAFIVVAVVVTIFGVNPQLGVPKLRKFIWFIGIPVAATLVTSFLRLSYLLWAFAVGTGVLSLRIIVPRLVEVIRLAGLGAGESVVPFLIDKGSMTYAQILMLGIVVTLGFICIRRGEKVLPVLWWFLLGIQVLAMVLMFKRGSWISAVLLVSLFLAVKVNGKYVLALLCFLIVAATAIPPVRGRIMALRKEFDVPGGRVTMWTQIAPVLVRKHPWGIGYRSLTNDMMREIDRRVEPRRDHLHCNVLQVLVATGWLGLLLYLCWMTRAVVDGWTFVRSTAGGHPEPAMYAFCLLLVMIGLLANGLVEYNFGDGEIVLVYGLVMGCMAAGRRLVSSQTSIGLSVRLV